MIGWKAPARRSSRLALDLPHPDGSSAATIKPMQRTLEDAFAGGSLIRPSDDLPNFVHLVRALAILTGVTGIERSAPVGLLIDQIGPCDHLVFILLDGLGMNLVRRLPGNSFIASNV